MMLLPVPVPCAPPAAAAATPTTSPTPIVVGLLLVVVMVVGMAMLLLPFMPALLCAWSACLMRWPCARLPCSSSSAACGTPIVASVRLSNVLIFPVVACTSFVVRFVADRGFASFSLLRVRVELPARVGVAPALVVAVAVVMPLARLLMIVAVVAVILFNNFAA